MRFLSLRQVTLVLLASTALVAPAAWGANYTVSTPTTVTNGSAGNVLNGNDSLTVTSTGSIATTTTHAVDATGNTNTIKNSGTVSTSGTGFSGISANGNTNTITNSGAISTSNDFNSGILTKDSNTITNSGKISSTGDHGVGINTSSSNTITNSGTISSTGTDNAGIFADTNNTIKNSGTISTFGDISAGIHTFGNNNNITNSGTISTSGTDNAGIYDPTGSGNTLTNSGTIFSTGTNSAGIYAGINNTIKNSGTISFTGNNSGGIVIFGNTTVTNSGTISSTGTSTTGIAAISGSGNNKITNSGTISASGVNSAGIVAGTTDTVTNSGKVVSAKSNSFKFLGTNDVLNLLAPSFIGGEIDTGTGNIVKITTGRSQSDLWDFSTYDTTPPSMSFSGPVPWAWDAATEKFATIDPTALSAAPDMLANMTGSLSDLTSANPQDGRWWLNGYGNFSGYGAQGIYNDYNNFAGGIATGASFAPSDNFTLGAMIGYTGSKLTVNSKWMTSQTIISKGVTGGISAKAKMNNMFVDFSLFAGSLGNASSRLVNDNLAPLGVDYANASYNSWFVSPQLKVGVDIKTGGNWTLTPSASARFSSQQIAGYTETGSNANATIPTRQVKVFEGNLELAATRKLEKGSVTLKGGAQFRQSLSGATQNVTLLGQTLAIPLNTTGTIIGYAGANADFAVSDTGTLSLGVKAAIGQNNYKSLSAVAGFSNKLL